MPFPVVSGAARQVLAGSGGTSASATLRAGLAPRNLIVVDWIGVSCTSGTTPGWTVTVSLSEKSGVAIEIEGLLVMSPAPERLRLRTLVDLETGRAETSLGEG